jgi:hypothetical protein
MGESILDNPDADEAGAETGLAADTCVELTDWDAEGLEFLTVFTSSTSTSYGFPLTVITNFFIKL